MCCCLKATLSFKKFINSISNDFYGMRNNLMPSNLYCKKLEPLNLILKLQKVYLWEYYKIFSHKVFTKLIFHLQKLLFFFCSLTKKKKKNEFLSLFTFRLCGGILTTYVTTMYYNSFLTKLNAHKRLKIKK